MDVTIIESLKHQLQTLDAELLNLDDTRYAIKSERSRISRAIDVLEGKSSQVQNEGGNVSGEINALKSLRHSLRGAESKTNRGRNGQHRNVGEKRVSRNGISIRAHKAA